VRILILNWKDLAHPNAGGAEVYTEHVARHLLGKGHDVTLFASAVRDRPERETVDGLPIVRRGSRYTVYREARKFWREARQAPYDIVIDEINTRPFMAPRFVGDVPVVALMHQLAKEMWRYEMPLPLALAGRYVLEPWWLRTYRQIPVMTDSPSSATSFAAYGITNAIPLPMGSEEFVRPEVERESTPTVVFLGRLVRSKRPEHAVAAFEVLRREVPEAQLWLLGDGPYGDKLKSDVPAGVSMLGHVSFTERQERLARAHVLVATSVREGWGLNVSEAAAVGTPAIGYDVAGLSDSVPASGGHLVPEDPDALGRALVDFFQGRLALTPRTSTVPWNVVGDAVEQVLLDRLAADPH
jgi:glycosyltransferase involved in cell wall biosynthesis